jgi:hypothetical protein
MVAVDEADVWFDPFKNTGHFYDQFPTENKVWTELLEGRDFFEFNDKVDVVCSNSPFSILDEVFEHIIELNPRVVALCAWIYELDSYIYFGMFRFWLY